MRSLFLSAVSAIGLLLLACALTSAPAAAQSGCTATYNCQGSSGCISVMGSNITHRTLSEYKDQASCDAAAKQIMVNDPLPSITCSCGGSGTTSTDLSGQMGQLIATMSPQQQMGLAVGAVGTLMIVKGLSQLMSGPTPDPAAQQRTLAAQQLNNSGIYLMKQKNYSGAVNEFQQALAQTPNDANIKNNLAMAKQAQQNSALAQQRSGQLGQLLGTTPAAGDPEVASNTSPLDLVNLNGNSSNSSASFNPGGTTQAPPQALQNQIDGALGTQQPAAPAPAQAQQIDQLFDGSQPAPPPPAPPQAQIDAEKTQVDDLFTAPAAAPEAKDAGSTPASAQLVQQASSGQAAANAASPEAASATAGQGFDTAAPGSVTPTTAASPSGAPQAPAAAAAPAPAPAPASSDVVDLRQTDQPAAQASQPAVVADLKSPPAPAPEYAITPLHEVSSGAAAPGSPIFDCDHDRTVIKRMTSGLPAQEDAIRRTEEAMKAAKEDSEDERKEAMEAAVSTMLSSATLAADWAQSGIAAAGAARSMGSAPMRTSTKSWQC